MRLIQFETQKSRENLRLIQERPSLGKDSKVRQRATRKGRETEFEEINSVG